MKKLIAALLLTAATGCTPAAAESFAFKCIDSATGTLYPLLFVPSEDSVSAIVKSPQGELLIFEPHDTPEARSLMAELENTPEWSGSNAHIVLTPSPVFVNGETKTKGDPINTGATAFLLHKSSLGASLILKSRDTENTCILAEIL